VEGSGRGIFKDTLSYQPFFLSKKSSRLKKHRALEKTSSTRRRRAPASRLLCVLRRELFLFFFFLSKKSSRQKTHRTLEKKNMVMDPDGIQSQELMCW
jgi:hypothetical protein